MKIFFTALLLGLVCVVSIFLVSREDVPQAIPAAIPEAIPAANYLAPPPVAATPDTMKARLDGVLLPSGYRLEWAPVGPNGEVGGKISEPGNLEISFWLSPPPGHLVAEDQTPFVSLASTLEKGEHQWAREQYISDELVELTLAADNTLAVTYPNRGLNLKCSIQDASQLAEALVIMLSVTNHERRLSWEAAKEMLGGGDVVSTTMLHTGTVFLNMTDGSTFETRQPTHGALLKCLQALGKEDQIPVATD